MKIATGISLKKTNLSDSCKNILKWINLSPFSPTKGYSQFLQVTAGFEPSAVASERAGAEGTAGDEPELLQQYKGCSLLLPAPTVHRDKITHL